MKFRIGRLLDIAVVILVIIIVFFTEAQADEKTGNLVFNAMKQIQDTHKTFLGDVKGIKTIRAEAIAEREAVKKQYEKASEGSLDKREFHARFSLAQAKVYRALYDEAKLTNQVSARQLAILNKLNDSISADGGGMNERGAIKIIEATKPFLQNGKTLLTSLADYRHRITDPVVNSKLNAAYQTAKMLSSYVDQLEKGRTNKYASHLILKQKIAELIDQLNALYVQTDIFMGMIQDKTTVLKMINQLAASEAAICAVSDGKKAIGSLSVDVILPLIDVLNESDDELNTLVAGVLDDEDQSVGSNGIVQEWTNLNF